MYGLASKGKGVIVALGYESKSNKASTASSDKQVGESGTEKSLFMI